MWGMLQEGCSRHGPGHLALATSPRLWDGTGHMGTGKRWPCWAQSARWDEGESDMAHLIQRPSRCQKPLGSLQMVVRTRWPVAGLSLGARKPSFWLQKPHFLLGSSGEVPATRDNGRVSSQFGLSRVKSKLKNEGSVPVLFPGCREQFMLLELFI